VSGLLPVPGDLTCVRRAAVIREPAASAILALPQVHDHQKAAGIVVQDTASVLFGVEGLQVIDAGPGVEGTVEVWAVTDHLATGRQPALRPGMSAQLRGLLGHT
jgi:hypothetical protein